MFFFGFFSELIALDTEYIDPTTWHPDSPNFTNKLDGSISVIDRNRSPQHSTLTTTKSVPILSEDRPPAVIPRDLVEDSSSRVCTTYDKVRPVDSDGCHLLRTHFN